MTVVRSRPRPVRPAPPSPQPPRRPPPPETLDQAKLINSDTQNDNPKNNEETTDMLNISAEQDSTLPSNDTFDLFANFPPPPSKNIPSADTKNQNVNLLFPEDDTFGDFLSSNDNANTTVFCYKIFFTQFN